MAELAVLQVVRVERMQPAWLMHHSVAAKGGAQVATSRGQGPGAVAAAGLQPARAGAPRQRPPPVADGALQLVHHVLQLARLPAVCSSSFRSKAELEIASFLSNSSAHFQSLPVPGSRSTMSCSLQSCL